MHAHTLKYLERLVAFETTPTNSNLDLIDWVSGLLGSFGAQLRRTFSDDGTKANLLASFGPSSVPGVLWSAHTDVVPVIGQNWSSNPFRVRAEHNRLYGRGTTDMKGFVACCLGVLAEVECESLRRPIHLALSFDEELGCLGVPRLVDDLVDSIALPAFAIVGEPTSMRLVSAHKGARVYETRFFGREAHSSQAHLGTSANVHAARFVGQLESTFAELEKETTRIPGLTPPFCTFNVGQMEGGTALNIIPAEALLVWEFRNIPELDGTQLEATLLGHLTDVALPAMRRTFVGARIKTKRSAFVPPLDPAGNRSAHDLLRSVTGAEGDDAVAFGTEAGSFQGAGIPTIVCGPGTIEIAHKPDEYIEISQLAAAETFLRRTADWATV